MARVKSEMTAGVDTENTVADDAISAEPVISEEDFAGEWETVAKESPIGVVFDKLGESFIGKYTGMEQIVPDKDEPFEILTFEDSRGKRYAISPSYKLIRAFSAITPGTWVRITYIANIPTGKAEPMKDFRVDAKKS